MQYLLRLGFCCKSIMEKEVIQINTKASNPIFSDEDFSDTPNILSYISFSIKDLLYWWYIQMPIFYLKRLGRVSTVVADQLSIGILIRNFFLPWKRHKAAVGYFIGMTTKLLYLPIAISLYLTIMILYLLFITIWTIIPFVAIFFTVISLFIN